MTPHIIIYDKNGNIILNLKERLTRIEGRQYVSAVPNVKNTIRVEGLQSGQKVWAAAMGQYLVAEVKDDVITWYFSVTRETNLSNGRINGFKYGGWVVYGVY